MTDTAPIYGIDLGTTCSTIGRVEHGEPKLVPIDGHVLIPSIVAFRPDGTVLVGRAAENQAALDPERTIRSAKRFMGTPHRFTIDGREITPGEVATEVLRYLADGVQRAHGARPTRVVITVPAWFTQPARGETQRAAEAAGLEVVRLINEPTAAALAHAHGQPLERRALVYDFGGGTFDVSLVEQSGALVEVRASHGDTNLGGDDIDGALAQMLIERVAESAPELAELLRASKPAYARLLLGVRDAKHELSDALKATVRVPFIGDLGGRALHLEEELDRADLEAVVGPLIERTLNSVDTVLRDASVPAGQIDELLMVGGSTRIPLVWHTLRQEYGWEGSAAVSPDLAVGLGAAIQAAIVAGIGIAATLIDVAPHSLALTAVDETLVHVVANVVTPRNAPLPSRHTLRFSTLAPNQSEAWFHIIQGSHPNPLRGVVLGRFGITGLPPAPKGQLNRPLSVEFRHDLDGMVGIRMTDELTGRSEVGHVVAGGDEVLEVRQQLIDELQRYSRIPGDGSDPDPWLRNEERPEVPAAVAPEPTVTLVPVGRDPQEAKVAFQSVLARERLLRAEHPECAATLSDLARRGLEDLTRGDGAGAIQRYDELSDLMFANGVYL